MTRANCTLCASFMQDPLARSSKSGSCETSCNAIVGQSLSDIAAFFRETVNDDLNDCIEIQFASLHSRMQTSHRSARTENRIISSLTRWDFTVAPHRFLHRLSILTSLQQGPDTNENIFDGFTPESHRDHLR
jgi:hypothetical protein